MLFKILIYGNSEEFTKNLRLFLNNGMYILERVKSKTKKEIKISDREIKDRSEIKEPDVIVVLNNNDIINPPTTDETIIIINTTKTVKISAKKKNIKKINATEMALNKGRAQYSWAVMLGALLKILGNFSLTEINKTVSNEYKTLVENGYRLITNETKRNESN